MLHTINVTINGSANNYTDIYKLSTQVNRAVQEVTSDWETEKQGERRVDRVDCQVSHK